MFPPFGKFGDWQPEGSSVVPMHNLEHASTKVSSETKEWDKWFSKLASFSQLASGWDSYRAEPPSESTIRAAEGFLTFLREKGISPTKLNPSVVGGVGFTFRHGPRAVYIEFRNTGNAHAAFSDDVSEPEVIKVRQDTSGYDQVLTKAESYLYEQTSPRHEDQRPSA